MSALDPSRPTLSVAIITKNEEANIRRTLESVKWADEIIVVDSGSTDRTCDIAGEFGAKVYVEEWKGFAKQKNSAIEKCTSDWILSLDADEEVTPQLASSICESVRIVEAAKMNLAGFSQKEIEAALQIPDLMRSTFDEYGTEKTVAFGIARKNLFLGRFIRHGGFFPDYKTRVFKKGSAHIEERLVHETLKVNGPVDRLNPDIWGALIHDAYPTLSGYIEHMNRYSDLGAEMAAAKGRSGFSLLNIVLRPIATFIYNYFLRLGFLDGREGLLLHLYHSVYVSWKYAKVWELSRQRRTGS
jgi:glycosyltransferase involved in cell wall biosynthesis